MGDLRFTGKSGYSWLSTASETYGCYLHFSDAELYPGYTTIRAYGLQLRCLSEQTETPLYLQK